MIAINTSKSVFGDGRKSTHANLAYMSRCGTFIVLHVLANLSIFGLLGEMGDYLP